MSEQPGKDYGRQIGEIVRSAVQSGDLSRLSQLGPVVGDAAREMGSVAKDVGTSIQKEFKDAAANPNPQQPNPQQPVQPGRPQMGQRGRPASGHIYGPQGRQARQNATMARRYAQTPARPAWQGSGLPSKRNLPGQNLGYGSIGFGVLGMVTFGLSALVIAGVAVAGAGWVMALAQAMGFGFALSAWLTAEGAGKRKLVKRVRQYYALFEQKPVWTFEELSAKVDRTPKQIKKDIRRAKKFKMLLDMRMDTGETCLMMGEDAYKLYLESEENRKKQEAEEEKRQELLEDPEAAKMERFKAEGASTIKLIRECNDAIPGEEISQKLDRLENTTGRVFAYVEKYPEKLPDTRKFMDYYLPTTLKLVEKYRQYVEMDDQSVTIANAKKDIEKALDTIDLAFNNMLEELYKHDTLDVSTDIEVLEKMLEQEGLTGQKFEVEETSGIQIREFDVSAAADDFDLSSRE